MKPQPAPVVSGKYISAERPLLCTQLIPLTEAGTSSKGATEEVSAGASGSVLASETLKPHAPAGLRNPLTARPFPLRLVSPRIFRNQRRDKRPGWRFSALSILRCGLLALFGNKRGELAQPCMTAA